MGCGAGGRAGGWLGILFTFFLVRCWVGRLVVFSCFFLVWGGFFLGCGFEQREEAPERAVG
ncbi:hypothetical protein BS50DRAFT_574670 [Corynespora cassiicola Philippines]|uniref:Uncharacterized protein n=1 Tax=Corynespora cassiicola Philippines TaxID=1448308 RepID=A0A2T2NMC9_CORCC|nr:hypothetical protein BS50DRAFT_574670 [Corynespora cassiicola Philippines]